MSSVSQCHVSEKIIANKHMHLQAGGL